MVVDMTVQGRNKIILRQKKILLERLKKNCRSNNVLKQPAYANHTLKG